MKIKDLVKRSIASNIRRARLNANMTQAEAAKKLGITAQAVSNFERGINNVENSLLVRMCEIYNTNMNTILGEEENPSEQPLTEGEALLLQLFRSIPEDQQPIVLNMIKAALAAANG